MAKYVCPSCGAPFNGKKCRNCAYENFSEEITHNLHVHKGEPLVIKDTTRKQIPYKDPFDCPKPPKEKQGKKKISGLPKVLLIIFLSVFLIDALSVLLARISDHSDWGHSDWGYSDWEEATSEAVSLPLDGKTLLDDTRFTIVAQWQDGNENSTDIPLYIINHTDEEYQFSIRDITVNGYILNDFCSFYAYAQPGETVQSTLYLEEDGLAAANISRIQLIEFSLEATSYSSKNNSSESFVVNPLDSFVLKGNAANGYVQPSLSGEKMLYADNDLILSYVCLWAGEYDDCLEDMELLFCAENSSENELSIYDDQILVNGEASGVSLWARLPAQSKTLFRVYLYGIDLSQPEEVESFVMDLRAYGDNLNTQLNDISVPIN